jgi:DNA-3-methyladenine glycosylase
VETEAYLGPTEGGVIDEAAHSWRGRTPRTEVIFGPPGHAYVYLIYGIYDCLNVVSEPEGSAGCVLIRAAEPLTGIEEMRQRRSVDAVEKLASGPGKLTRALGITLRHNGADLTRGPLTIREPEREQPFEIGVSPRIGISRSVDWPLRFFVAGSRFVSNHSLGSGATLKKHAETDHFSRVRYPRRRRNGADEPGCH